MCPRLVERQDAEVDLPEAVRRTAGAILRLLDTAPLEGDVAANLRTTCDGVQRRLAGRRLTVAFVGEAGVGRRTLYNAMLGDRVLVAGAPRRGSTVSIVRRAAFGFVAHSQEGRCVANLARKMPGRDALFSRSMDQLQREMRAREDLASRVASARAQTDTLPSKTQPEEPSSPIASPSKRRTWWHSLWSWMRWVWARLVRNTAALPGTRFAPALDGGTDTHRQQHRETITALEHELAGMPAKEQIEARMERLRVERQTYEGERRAAFLSLVREVDGTDIAERIIEFPSTCLPEDLTLVDLPSATALNVSAVGPVWTRAMREIDALVLVADFERSIGSEIPALVREMKEVAPLVLVVLTKVPAALSNAARPAGNAGLSVSPSWTDALDRVLRTLGPHVERPACIVIAAETKPESMTPEHENSSDWPGGHLRSTAGRVSQWLHHRKPGILALRESMRMEAGISELLRAEASEEESCRKRLVALESKPIPDPADLRGHLLGRVESAIAKGADDVLGEATGRLHEEFEALRKEWRERIASCAGRSEVESCAEAINESAPQRIANALKRTAEHVARELQQLSETLERWALEEVHTQYQLVRRLEVEALSPVASELTRDDLEQERAAMRPAEAALDAFERQRVGYGLGGVAAGAMLGTLIAPGIGTALGAIIGVFAGLLKGVESLKQECIEKVGAFLDDAETHARSQLASKKPDLSRVVRVTLDDALDAALTRLGDAIDRLRRIEREAIERERTRLAGLNATRVELERCQASLADRRRRVETIDQMTKQSV